jgi:hypothetical protein
MAAFEVIALDTATPQLRAPGASDTYTHPRQSLFLAGTAAAPGIAGNSDDNTGMLWPAADTLAWATGGAEQMRLTSTGLGIGTSSPAYKLDVVGTLRLVDPGAGRDVLFAASTTGSAHRFYSTNTVAGYSFENSAGALMLLDSSGNLGLGVTPSAWSTAYRALDMGTGAIMAQASGTDTYYTQNAIFGLANTWVYKFSSVAATRYEQVNGVHAWYTAPSGTAGNTISFTQAMTLDASGNLLVGTTSALLSAANRGNITLNGASTSVLVLGTGNAATTYFYNDGTNADFWNAQNGFVRFGTNNTERARIPAAGGMVVGTAALATTATDGFLYVPTCAGTPTGTPTTQTGTARIVVDTTNNKLYFYSGGQWRDAGP